MEVKTILVNYCSDIVTELGMKLYKLEGGKYQIIHFNGLNSIAKSIEFENGSDFAAYVILAMKDYLRFKDENKFAESLLDDGYAFKQSENDGYKIDSYNNFDMIMNLAIMVAQAKVSEQ